MDLDHETFLRNLGKYWRPLPKKMNHDQAVVVAKAVQASFN
jgi:hypothetical protein